jgi:SAM-dependent methyltransferase
VDRPVRVSEAQRIRILAALTAPVEPCRCLLVAPPGQPAELQDQLFASGGDWVTIEIAEAASAPSVLPFSAGTFDRVVVVDARARVADPAALDREVARVLAPGGAAIVTEPKGRTKAARGQSWRELQAAMLTAGLRPVARAAHSGYFALLADVVSVTAAGRASQEGTSSAQEPSFVPRLRGQTSRLAVSACTFLDRLLRGRGGAPAIVALKPCGDDKSRDRKRP